MKKMFIALTWAVVANLSIATASFAQATDPKLEWASKVVALQQGPELERLVSQLADSATQEVLQNWGPKLLANVPKAKLEQARDDLNVQLKKYFDDVSKSIAGKVPQVSKEALVPAYMERFTLDELKQLVAFFESPAIKKYQASAPELGNLFVKQLVEATRADVTSRVRQFDDAAFKIVGTAPASKAPPSASEKSKPATKK